MADGSRLQRIFDEVADLPATARDARLDELCAGEPELRAEVEMLLAHDGGEDSLADVVRRAADALSLEGTKIGPYLLGERIGAGGMGEVYAAEQTEPVQRSVALKLIKPGLDTGRVIARFEAERRALARMEHSTIARILDAGATDAGRPFFVMERVEGQPITRYCDARRMGVRGRIELFVRVCEGVQHAHQRGILHRDLKPSNVMVASENGRPIPKIIDFGVALAITEDDDATQTREEGWLGTPDYMSPEQVSSGRRDLDTRSDVYSLGVLLYELLVGARPFARSGLRHSTPDEVRAAIRDEEPATPSRIAAGVEPQVAGARGETPASLARLLRGDLDWILLKALDKQPDRRYGSPGALAEELRRTLADEPIEAGPPSAIYRTGKFVRRHRLAVTVAALVLATLLMGIAGTTHGLLRARRAETAALGAAQEARAEARTQRRVAGFFDDMLRRLSARRIGETMTRGLRERSSDVDAFDRALGGVNVVDAARETLDTEFLSRASGAIDEQLADEPSVAARLRLSLARAYQSLGEHDRGAEQAREALRLASETGGDLDPVALGAARRLVSILFDLGEYEEALDLSRRQVALCRDTFGEADERTLLAREDLGQAHKMAGDYPAAADELRIVYEAYRDDPAVSAEQICTIGRAYGSARVYAGDPVGGAEILREVYDLSSRDGVTLNALSAQTELGRALMIAGRYAEAEKELLAAHAELAARRGREHDSTITAASLVAAVYGNWERWEPAVSWSREMMRLRTERYGADHPNAAYAKINLGFILHHVGEDEEARQRLTEAADVLESRTPPHPGRFHAYMGLAMIDYGQQRFEAAAERQRETLRLRIEAFGDDHIDVVESRTDLAKTLIELGRLDEAERLLRRAYDGLTDDLLGPDFRLTVEINLADVLRRQNRIEEAAGMLAQSEAVVARMDEVKPSTRSLLAYARAGLAAARGDRETAERSLGAAVAEGEPGFRAARDPDLGRFVEANGA